MTARAAAVLAALALLSACTTDPGTDEATTAAVTGTAATDPGSGTDPGSEPAGSAGTTDPAEETDSVQTDPPVTDSALVLTSADGGSGEVTAAAFVQGLVELGGTCTLVAAQDGDEVTGDPTDAEPGPSTTDCGSLSVTLPDSAGGTWQVHARYSSDTTDLISTTVEVEVP
jgi:hypothetical protein